MLFPPSPSEGVSLFTPTFYIVEKLRIGEYVKISSFACHIQILEQFTLILTASCILH